MIMMQKGGAKVAMKDIQSYEHTQEILAVLSILAQSQKWFFLIKELT
jgi:hypothetical protein